MYFNSGSILGDYPDSGQPSQKWFETELYNYIGNDSLLFFCKKIFKVQNKPSTLIFCCNEIKWPIDYYEQTNFPNSGLVNLHKNIQSSILNIRR